MLVHDALGFIRVLSPDCRDQHAVFRVALVGILLKAFQIRDQENVESCDHLIENVVAAEFRYLEMERVVRLLYAADVALCDSGLEPACEPGELLHFGRARVLRCAASAQRLESQPDVVDVQQLGKRELFHEDPPTGHTHNQHVALEAGERGEDRCPRNTKLSGEILLHQLLVRLELTGENHAADGLVGLLGKYLIVDFLHKDRPPVYACLNNFEFKIHFNVHRHEGPVNGASKLAEIPTRSTIIRLRLIMETYRQITLIFMEGLMDKKRVVILGAGAMGSAFSFPAADNGHEVRLVGTHLDDLLIEETVTHGVHPRAGVLFPENVRLYHHSEISAAMTPHPDLVVLGVSSEGVEWAIGQLKTLLRKPVPLALLTKGLAVVRGRLRPFTETVAASLGGVRGEEAVVSGVGGPCIAAELAARRPTSVIVGSPKASAAAELHDLLQTSYYRVRTTDDAVGVEACAALKNFYAIAVGAAAGWVQRQPAPRNHAAMHNSAASIFARALQEMEYIVTGMGGTAESVYGLAGSGDLYVTCQAGRNSRMGKLLGEGRLYSEAKAQLMPDDTVEGAELARVIGPVLEAQMAAGEIDGRRVPLAKAVIDAVCHDEKFEVQWESLWE